MTCPSPSGKRQLWNGFGKLPSGALHRHQLHRINYQLRADGDAGNAGIEQQAAHIRTVAKAQSCASGADGDQRLGIATGQHH